MEIESGAIGQQCVIEQHPQGQIVRNEDKEESFRFASFVGVVRGCGLEDNRKYSVGMRVVSM